MAKQRNKKEQTMIWISIEIGHKKLVRPVWFDLQIAFSEYVKEYSYIVSGVKEPDWNFCLERSGLGKFAMTIEGYDISGEIYVDLERVIIAGWCPFEYVSIMRGWIQGEVNSLLNE